MAEFRHKCKPEWETGKQTGRAILVCRKDTMVSKKNSEFIPDFHVVDWVE